MSDIKPKSEYMVTKSIDAFFMAAYEAFQFIVTLFKETFSAPFEWKETIRQCYQVGYKSLSLVTMTGFIIGIVFTKQSRPSLSAFGATSWLPSLISIAIIRALAPLVTGLIVSGKVGSNIGAELGSMKVTEQIDAMEVSATNPFKFLVVTRVLATTLMMPLLVIYSGLVGMMGSFLNIHQNESTSFSEFIKNAFSSISFLDINSSIFKAVFYGFTIGIAGCFQGYNAHNGTQGVGKAANRAVVVAMFMIFLEEVIIVQIVNAIR
ncbi:MAG: ABC transporter permease [Cytophagaceae bacterium]|nr:ABC transporter permease [Cytophagaceae bacterium]MBK9508417.1 ABC transporter permease [Cytophagaceae bacterium]MBK9932852.1 ABC transporter permease [Cytophagaceae bacterium]MBL0303459.1 ABC transporter permease [Cytophagaceae bacterium]MBL0326287.1 ABC transporter permease [Cytophagaceae bacterium]